MKKIKKILVPLDGSKNSLRALEQALLIARGFGASVTGMHVIKFPYNFGMQIKKQYRKNADRIMEDASRRVEKVGVSFDKVIRTNGYIGSEIVKFAQGKKFDIIVIGSRGPNPIGEIFIGSVANYVLHRSKVPVLLVK